MTRLLPLVLFCAFSAEAGLIAPDYVLVKCSEYAGGCPSESSPRALRDASVDYSAAYEAWWLEKGYDPQYGYSAWAVDSANGWVLGRVLDPPMDTWFVYHPDHGIVCCTTDTPFEIVRITEHGYLVGRAADDYSPGFISHVSVIDGYPTNLFNYQSGIRSAEAESLQFFNSYFYGRDSAGRIYGNGGWGWSIGDQDWRSDGGQFVLIPLSDVHAPEPASLTMTALGAVGLCGMAVRRRRAKQAR